MKKFLYSLLLILPALLTNCVQRSTDFAKDSDEFDGPDKIAEMEYNRTKDPATGRVPRNTLVKALKYTDSLQKELPFQVSAYGSWTERGPNSDAVGPSNGNTRANSGITSGRMRAILVDAADATGNTVFVGGVNGGLWKTTNITLSPATWTLVNDFFSNMAVTSICQNPLTPATMYFATGEWPFNSDAVAGDGIWKSTDGGVNWSQLANTTGSDYDYCSKILCDAAGNVYVTTRTGVFRSINGGTNWTNITPSGLASNRFSDMEISSTGRLHVSAGQFTTCSYRFTDIPATVAAGTWTSATSGYPASGIRIELGCNGATLYALPSDGTYHVPTIYKSTDGGANWAATTGQPALGWASGQAWYNLAVDVDGSGNVIVGALDPYKSINGGILWTKLADWTNNPGLPPTTTQYVHADIHYIKMYGANRVLFGCDGGIHYSSDGGTTIRDRNVGLRLKQFFSVAIHPTSGTNHFLAGAQDNGTHLLTSAGLGASVEVKGGDGAFVHIDQNEPQYQFGAYVYQQYRRSINTGANWSDVNLSGSAIGQFINPTDYDDVANIMYCADAAGGYRRWTNPQSGSTNAVIAITAFNASSVLALKVSPYTANRVYFGTAGGRVTYVDNAHSTASGSAGTNISTGLPVGFSVSCIEVGSNDNNLIVSYSNYSTQQVWISTNGGGAWTNVEGNLPDMPVRWCMLVPGNDDKAIIATEAGVYLTQDLTPAVGGVVWIPSPTFPTVRTDMLQYRASDGLIAAATHGRGVWTQSLLSVLPVDKFLLRGKWNGNNTDLQWEYVSPASGATLEIEMSDDAVNFTKAGSLAASPGTLNYNYRHTPNKPNIYYRVKSNEKSGVVKYSNTIKLFKSGAANRIEITSLHPNPVQTELNVGFTAEKGKFTYMITSLAGQTIWRKEEDLQFTGNYIKNWNIAAIKPGAYVFSIISGNQRSSQKFIKK